MPDLSRSKKSLPSTRPGDVRNNDCRPTGPQRLSDQILLKMVNTLRSVEQKVFGRRHKRTDFYAYLAKVYEVYIGWAERAAAKRNSLRVATLMGIRIRKNTHPIRVLIDASCGQGMPAKSLWTQALRFAALKGVQRDALPRFLKERGGVTGCAREMADRLRS